jgi:fibronectin type 3 domain-containing protein
MTNRTVTFPETIASKMNLMVSGDKLTVNPGIYREQVNPKSEIEIVMTDGAMIKGSNVVTGWTTESGGRFSKSPWTTNSQQVFVDGVPLRQIGGVTHSSYSHPNLPPVWSSSGVTGVWPGRVAGDENSMAFGDFHYDIAAQKLWIKPTGGIAGKTIEVSVRSFIMNADNIHDVIWRGGEILHSNQTATGQSSSFRIIGDRWFVDGLRSTDMDHACFAHRGNDSEISNCKFLLGGLFGAIGSGRNNYIHHNEYSFCNTRGFSAAWGAGGFKTIGASQLDGISGMVRGRFEFNEAYENAGPGFWWDTNQQTVSPDFNIIKGNKSAYNTLDGFFYEISTRGKFIDNYAWANGWQGIDCNGRDCIIEHNLVAYNARRTIQISLDTRLTPINNTSRYNLIAWNNIANPAGNPIGAPDHDYTLAASTYPVVSNFNLWVETSGLPILAVQGEGSRSGVAAFCLWTGKDCGSWDEVLAIPPSIANAIAAKSRNIDWTPLFDLANTINPSNPPGPSQSAPASPPLAPTGLIAISGQDVTVPLSWNASAGATSYRLKRASTSGGPYPFQKIVTTTSTTSTGLTNGETYFYVVTAINANGESADSNEVSATPAAPPPPSPSAPTGLEATAGNGEVSLAWNAAAGEPTSYTVKYGTANGGPYPNTIPGIITTSRLVTGLVNNTPHYFVVSASNAGGESPNSSQVSATPVAPVVQPPAAPTGLNIEPHDQALSATWNASPTALSYTVKWGTAAGGPYPNSQSGITDTVFLIANLSNGVTYRVVVSASNADGESANSNEFAATPEPTPQAPQPPTNLFAIAGDGEVIVGWNGAEGALSYSLKWGTQQGGPYPEAINDITITARTVQGLQNGILHFFVVSAINDNGESLNSAEVSATPQAPPPEPEPEEEEQEVIKLKTGVQQIITALNGLVNSRAAWRELNGRLRGIWSVLKELINARQFAHRRVS